MADGNTTYPPQTLGEWDRAITGLSDGDLTKYRAALEALQDWPDFHKAFKFSGMFALAASIRCEQDARRTRKWGNR